MTPSGTDEAVGAPDPTLRAIADSARRAVLARLLSSSPATVTALAEYVASERCDAVSQDTDDADAVRSALVHRHLPLLADARLIAWDREAARIEPTAHPAFDDPRFERLLELDVDGVDEALSALAHEYRRLGLAVLVESGASMSRADLAKAIHRRAEATDSRSDPVSIAVSLHHSHLPKLAAWGIVEYDTESGVVSYAGHSALEAVIEILSVPPDRFVDKYDGFLSGLSDTPPAEPRPVEWLDFWSDYSHG